MGKFQKILISFLFMLLFIPMVNAECDYETQVKLATEAANVKAVYEVVEVVLDENDEIVEGVDMDDVNDETDYGLGYMSQVSIMNLTENIYIVVTDADGNETTYYFEDSDAGTVEFLVDVDSIHNFTIYIYSNISDCINEEINHVSLVTPMRNSIAEYSFCDDLDVYFCELYTTVEIDMTIDEVYEYAQNHKNTSEEVVDNTETETSFWELYGVYIICVVGFLLLGGLIYIIIRIKQRSDVI